MKRIIILIFISLATIGIKAQNQPLITVGVGYPVFLSTKSDDAHYDYFINKKNYNLYLEKQLKFLKQIPEISITPGLAFTHITENYDYEGLGGGGKGDYKHKAFSGFVKVLYEIERQPEIATDYYFGIQVGYYFSSKTDGSRSSWQMNPDGGNYTNSEEIDKSGEDFFHSNYIGLIAGIAPLGDKKTFIKPKIELGFYPAFATVNSYFVNGEEKKNMLQISISADIGTKKKKAK